MDFQGDIDAIDSIEAVPKILSVVCAATGMGFSAVARVTEDRWICCAVKDDIDFGLKPGGELQVETTICHEIRQSGIEVIIDHVSEDSSFRSHHTPATYGFQSYISVPIVLKDGSFFGTLCAIDPRPAQLKNEKIIGMFKLFAELIANHLDTILLVKSNEGILLSERKTSELREQFIAVLGHDLRNPLASIAAGARLLGKAKLDDKTAPILPMMLESVRRMSVLIDNVMDFARGRLGGGLDLNRQSTAMEPVLNQVIAEFHTSLPDREIVSDFDLAKPVNCDSSRIAQLFSNLLGNALTYSEAPVVVTARSGNGFELSVTNRGAPIPETALDDLFKPFWRGAVRRSQQGLGLGLYIVSEIAKAHGGTIGVVSNATETTFTLRMP